MKFKYKLVEQETDDAVNKRFAEKKDLILTAVGDTSIETIVNKLSNPDEKSLKGFYVPRSKDIENDIFGLPSILANKKKNAQMMQTQIDTYGKPFYMQVEDLTGMKFKGFQTSKFPVKNIDNIAILKKYIKLTSDFASNKPKSTLRWDTIRNGNALKFFTDNKEITSNMINSILSNSGLTLGKDYELSIEKLDENKLKKLVKEEILKFYKK